MTSLVVIRTPVYETRVLTATEKEGFRVGVVRNRRFLGGVGVGFLTTLRVVGFFVRLRKSSWIIFHHTLLNWEFLLKLYNFY